MICTSVEYIDYTLYLCNLSLLKIDTTKSEIELFLYLNRTLLCFTGIFFFKYSNNIFYVLIQSLFDLVVKVGRPVMSLA